MELAALIEALSQPEAYPTPPVRVDVRQTHISVVFLAGQLAYKIKKPVRFSFVDFSTLERRKHFCQEELRLNAPLAGDVYRRVVPIVERGAKLHVGGEGNVVDWAVEMRRLSDDATLESLLGRQAVSQEQIERLGKMIAAFHRSAPRSDVIAARARLAAVSANARANFSESRGHIGQTISPDVFARLEALTDEALAEHAALIESRAARGMPCDTHGDLRLDHVYLLGESGRLDLRIIDCVEFNEALRQADPVSDVAFLVMDLKRAGAANLADALAEAYFSASGDEEGRALLPFYVAYRAAVRGKVEGLKQAEAEVSPADREEARQRGIGYWLLALSELETQTQRPALILVSGLPGSGKSTLAAALAERTPATVIRSDVVRKELAGLDHAESATAGFGQGIYRPELTRATYNECLRRAEAELWIGQRAIVDASFREDTHRQAFLKLARRWCVPAMILECHTPREVAYQRLENRRGDASDADRQVYDKAARLWEPPGAMSAAAMRSVDSNHAREQVLAAAVAHLQAAGL